MSSRPSGMNGHTHSHNNGNGNGNNIPKQPQPQPPAGNAHEPEERQSLLSFYQRYSYSTHGGQSPRRRNTDTNSLLSPQNISSNWQDAKTYLNAELSTKWAEIVLFACFFVSGFVDAGAYNAYECFISMQVRAFDPCRFFSVSGSRCHVITISLSMTTTLILTSSPSSQTGNTIFAALGVSDLPVASPKWAWTKSVVSIVSFLLGASLFSLFHRQFGGLKRWVLATSFTFQTIATTIAAILVASGTTSDSPAKRPSSITVADTPSDPGFPWADLIPIGLLAFQAAGKVVASRVLGYNALPSVVLTTLYNDLVSDPGLFTAGLMGNVQRNRRAGGLVLYFGGAIVGGALAKSTVGFAGALWFAAFVKILLVAAWLLWHEDKNDVEDEES